MKREKQPVVVASYSRGPQGIRAATIVRDDRKDPDMRFEVVYEMADRSPEGYRQVSWRFFATRKEAEAFVREVR